MAEKQYKYAARIKQPQTIGNVKLDPKGGFLSEREMRTVKKDAYGASLLEKEWLIIEEAPGSPAGETIPDSGGKDTSTTTKRKRPEDEHGGKPE
jgi:hypothetical protein